MRAGRRACVAEKVEDVRALLDSRLCVILCDCVCVRGCVCVMRPHLYAPLVILDSRIKSDTIIDVLCPANTDMENMDHSGDGIDCLKCL